MPASAPASRQVHYADWLISISHWPLLSVALYSHDSLYIQLGIPACNDQQYIQFDTQVNYFFIDWYLLLVYTIGIFRWRQEQ
jgi:hypothetical protein